MKLKIGESIPKQECLVMDRMTGTIYMSDLDEMRRMQSELNEKLFSNRTPSLMEVYEIMTKDWPEEKRKKFFEHLNKYEGWTCTHPVEETQLVITHCEDGQLAILFEPILQL